MFKRQSLRRILFVAVVLALFLLPTQTLRSRNQQTLQQQDLAYYQSLSKQERDAKSQLTNLKKEIKYLKQTLDQVQDLPSVKTVALEQGLADERDTLYSLQQDLTVPFDMKTVECKNLTADQERGIRDMVNKIKKQTEILKITIDGMTGTEGCVLCNELRKQYDWDLLYLRELQSSLKPCPALGPSQADLDKLTNVAKYTKISNLNSAPWIFGAGMTEPDYYIRLFNRNKDSNMTKCPPDAPFIINRGKDCAACPKDTPIFQLSSQTCVSCPLGTKYDENIHKCQLPKIIPIIPIIPPIKKCKNGQIFNSQSKNCECPQGAPYFTGQKCIACLLPQFFNQTTRKCQTCPEDQKYDSAKGECSICEQGRVFNEQSNRCQCPKISPFEDNTSTCVACYLPKYWNLDEKKCEFCRIGSYYDVKLLKCVQCPDQQPLSVNGLCKACPAETNYNPEKNKCEGQKIDCKSNYLFSESLGACLCPNEKPFDAGDRCVSCYLPQYWSPKDKKCISCEEDQLFNYHSNKCEYCPTDKPLIEGYSCIACQSGRIYDIATDGCIKKRGQDMVCPQGRLYSSTEKGCVCPKVAPFDDGQECTTCYLPSYWNYTSKSCQTCDQNLTFNPKAGKCQNCPPDSPLLDENGKCAACPEGTLFKQSKNNCISRQQFCPRTFVLDEEQMKCVCPQQAPFNDGSNCVSCSLPRYWDKKQKACLECGRNQFYDTETNKCQYCPENKPIFNKFECTSCPSGTVYSKRDMQCIKLDQYCSSQSTDARQLVWDPKKKQCICPPEKPFDDGNRCVSCYLPKYWDHNQKACLSCQNGKLYSTEEKKCVNCPAEKPILADDGYTCQTCPSNTFYSEKSRSCVQYSSLCPANYQFNPDSKKCQCPKSMPFNDGSHCIACYLPQYWSNSERKCLSCPTHFIYDTESKKCVRCPDDKPFLAQGGLKCQPCPKRKPFFDGDKCVACFLPKYWNIDDRRCQDCPTGKEYDTQKLRCV